MVEAEVDVEEGWAREVEGRWENGADILESHRVTRVRIVGDDDSCLRLVGPRVEVT